MIYKVYLILHSGDSVYIQRIYTKTPKDTEDKLNNYTELQMMEYLSRFDLSNNTLNTYSHIELRRSYD